MSSSERYIICIQCLEEKKDAAIKAVKPVIVSLMEKDSWIDCINSSIRDMERELRICSELGIKREWMNPWTYRSCDCFQLLCSNCPYVLEHTVLK